MIDVWVENHKDDLWRLLGDGRYILYGEWLYAVHSLKYSSLSDYFIAFDLYDRFARKFLSRAKFYSLIDSTSIYRVPTIARDFVMSNQSDLYPLLLNTMSEFAPDTHIEGMYIRLDEGDYLKDRAKVIGPTFSNRIQESTRHWKAKPLEMNSVIS
jgi:atypical dual specificity phosphatase